MSGQLVSGVSNEFRLVCACSIWPPSDRRNAAIVESSATIDWDKLARVATRHRVVGLVHDGLRRANIAVPASIDATIGVAAGNQVRQNLLFAAEIVRLQRAFDDRQLPVTVFKGVPTAIDVYGDIGIRHAKDLDLLVSRASMAKAEAILGEMGYARVAPPADLDAARVATLMLVGKDFIFQRRENSTIEVELHWRLFNNASFLNQLADKGELKTYPELNNTQLRTFVGDDLFAYLCAHGAAFAWCRLKWLADIGALLARADPASIRRLYESAAQRGAARPAAQAILLCRELLGTQIPDTLVELLHRDPAVQRLENLAMAAMTQGGAEAEPYDLPSGMTPIDRSLWLMSGSPRYLWGEINARWISWDDVVAVPLPRGLQFLYPVLRAPLWIWRKIAKARLRSV